MPRNVSDPPPFPTANVLARITDTPQLARVVPLLQPEVLHAVITHCGLQDCGELLTLATAEQLSAVLDLDLWTADHAGAEEQFDVARFSEWLEVLVDAGPHVAAQRLAHMDEAVVVAGLSPNIEVFDLAAFSPDGEDTGADAVMNAGPGRGVHAEIGGFLVVAQRQDGWDAIVAVLLALAEQHPGAFDRLMRACRTLTNAGWEIDGLDNLLSDEEQAGLIWPRDARNAAIVRDTCRRSRRACSSRPPVRCRSRASRHRFMSCSRHISVR